ncbi:NACHT, LRR and PYD domains-containing protein 10 [Holothuria leucospilota]|uniref:NACHT, LRR and PYD domains-containing protein 10 n=1 Tax=Holothuria leucospilota TaxID=206669 RepID=A0A9Q1CDS3_HOLLE|nr:NACHT, LRR and PYD domains-containing protein 10 [Holothuria leucospilota]
MAYDLSNPLHIIQDSRYAKQDGWEVDDISLCSSGNIAVSGRNYSTGQSYVSIYGCTVDNSDSRDKPTLLYHKQLIDKEFPWRPRYISFVKPNSAEIITCRYDQVQVIDYNRDVVLRSRKVNGWAMCVSVSESQIFIGIQLSDIVNIYDKDLNRIKSIRLKEIREDYPLDIAEAADRLYVRTWDGRAIVYSQDNGRILTEYTTVQEYSGAYSIAVNIELGLTAVLWHPIIGTEQDQIIMYLLSENKSFLTLNVESGVFRIRISEKGRIVTGTQYTGEVKMYNLASVFSYSRLKQSLVSRLGRDDCEKLADFFAMGGEELNGILNSNRPASTLLFTLEEKGVMQPSNVDRLEEAFLRLEMSPSYHAVNMYQKLSDIPIISTFEKFIAGFSTFLKSDLFEALCEHFNISASERSEALSNNAPGLSLLVLLKAKNIITPTDVSALTIPAFATLKQVVTKINKYQRDLRESKISLLEHQRELTPEEKADIFIYYLHLNIKSWYEFICPLPWKKASHWGLSDLFIACGLTLTNTKSHTSLTNVDDKCIVTYDDIFIHSTLKDALRIVVEGNPGSGKTMLASQIAYDWMEGKFENTKFAILLQLKYLEDMTIPEAITKLILPLECPLTEADVEVFLEKTDPGKVCLIFDGLEEYTGGGRDYDPQQSEVMKVMNREKLPATKVIITTRSEYLQDLPDCPMLKLRPFGKQERYNYVKKIFPQDDKKQNDVIMAVENDPLLLELCDVPLLFVMAVHNIDKIANVSDDETEKVTPFVRNIIQTLCTMEHEGAQLQDQLEELKSSDSDSDEWETIDSDDSAIFHLTLEEVAFNGLCTGKQQFLWPMNFVQNKIINVRLWIDSGILIVEEEIRRKKKSVPKNTTMEVILDDDLSPSDKSRKDLLTEMNIETKDMRPEIKDDDASIILDVVTPSGDKQHTVETSIDRDISKNAITVLQVRFLHKIIQEWFAAKHLSNLLENYNEDEVERCLNLISPIELHYVLRFACEISSEASPLILTYLNRYHRGLDNNKKRPVADCICQCFLEHRGGREGLKEVVTDFCKTSITICKEDSRQLQKAEISLLNFASENKILVLKVKLVDVWQSLLTKGNIIRLYLNSGVHLPPLCEVQSLTITSWDLKLQDLDLDLLMKYLFEWPSLQEVDLHFPVPPPKLGEDLVKRISLKHKKVTWSIGSVTHYLNEKGEWPPIDLTAQSSSLSPSTHQQQKREGAHSWDEKSIFDTKAVISREGGKLCIPDTGVKLYIPPNAFEDDIDQCLLRMRIILPGECDVPAASFTSNTSTVVELLPNNLRLKQTVILTLPHCLDLEVDRGDGSYTVQIFISHHERGTSPVWKAKSNLLYYLDDTKCVMWLESFCWVKFEVNGSIVKGKKIQVFAAGKVLESGDNIVETEVGYFPDLPSGGEILRNNKNLILSQQKPFLFLKKEKLPLTLSLLKVTPLIWKPLDDLQEIPYESIANSVEHSCPFIF